MFWVKRTFFLFPSIHHFTFKVGKLWARRKRSCEIIKTQHFHPTTWVNRKKESSDTFQNVADKLSILRTFKNIIFKIWILMFLFKCFFVATAKGTEEISLAWEKVRFCLRACRNLCFSFASSRKQNTTISAWKLTDEMSKATIHHRQRFVFLFRSRENSIDMKCFIKFVHLDIPRRCIKVQREVNELWGNQKQRLELLEKNKILIDEYFLLKFISWKSQNWKLLRFQYLKKWRNLPRKTCFLSQKFLFALFSNRIRQSDEARPKQMRLK